MLENQAFSAQDSELSTDLEFDKRSNQTSVQDKKTCHARAGGQPFKHLKTLRCSKTKLFRLKIANCQQTLEFDKRSNQTSVHDKKTCHARAGGQPFKH